MIGFTLAFGQILKIMCFTSLLLPKENFRPMHFILFKKFPLPKLSRASLDRCIQTPKEKKANLFVIVKKW
jgi:hypothetical protein